MNAQQSYIIREITPLSDKDCFYVAERYKTEFTYPIHNHAEFELNFCEKAAGVRRIVGDSAEVIGDYDLVLITGQDLEHVWEQNECNSKEIREITIQFSPDLFSESFINKNQFDSIRRMLERAQKGLCFPMSAIMKVYSMLDTLASEKQGFYAVLKFMTILYELSLFEEESRTLSSSSFANAVYFARFIADIPKSAGQSLPQRTALLQQVVIHRVGVQDAGSQAGKHVERRGLARPGGAGDAEDFHTNASVCPAWSRSQTTSPGAIARIHMAGPPLLCYSSIRSTGPPCSRTTRSKSSGESTTVAVFSLGWTPTRGSSHSPASSMNPLDRTALRNILTEPKNSIIKQYIKLFEMDGVKLEFQPEVFEYIVDKAIEYKLGARGLRSIVETIMMDVMFEIPSQKAKKYEVTLDFAKQQMGKANISRMQTA